MTFVGRTLTMNAGSVRAIITTPMVTAECVAPVAAMLYNPS